MSNTIEISDELMKSGLNILGKHPLTQSHVYLEFKCIGNNINNLLKLKKYPYLLYIDLSNNDIDDLNPLASIKCLTQLRLRYNKLTNCLKYEVPQCNLNNIWSNGHSSIGSMLTLVDLSFNLINKIDDLTNHPFIEVLILSNNKISKIEGLNNLKYLKVLDLSNNLINEIDGLDHLNINELDLSYNNIKQLNGLNNLNQLHVLKITNNHISSLGPLSMCPHIYHLDIQSNNIEYIRQVEFLCEIRWLKILKLYDNPCCNKLFYRFRVVYRLPDLNILDTTNVSAEEKIRAMNIYLAHGGDLEERAKNFYKYFPNDEFHSYSYNFLDDENDLSAKYLYDCDINSKDVVDNEEDNSLFPVGTRVEVDFRSRGRWYPGRISKVRDDGYYDIEYDDGDIELRVNSQDIKLLILSDNVNHVINIGKYNEGMEIEANYNNQGNWLKGKVIAIKSNDFYDIEYSNGTLEYDVEFNNIRPIFVM